MTADSASLLAAVVDGLVEALESLSEDLATEREALTRRTSADDLEAIAVRKGIAVEYVASLYAQLRETLVEATGDRSVTDSMSLLKAHVPQLGGQVEKLVELTRTCQVANQENGALIGAGLRSSQAALDTLHKLSATSTAGTYSASGHTDAEVGAATQLTVRA